MRDKATCYLRTWCLRACLSWSRKRWRVIITVKSENDLIVESSLEAAELAVATLQSLHPRRSIKRGHLMFGVELVRATAVIEKEPLKS